MTTRHRQPGEWPIKSERQRLFAEGLQAHDEGKKFDACSYAETSLDRHFWLCGWWKGEYAALAAYEARKATTSHPNRKEARVKWN